MSQDKEKPVPISKQSSKALASRVVAFRVLGFDKQGSIDAMKELAARQEEGDDFDFNSYIEEKIAETPKPTIGEDQIKSIADILKHVKSGTI